MTETVVTSPNREVRIGFDRPFVIIGERINPTGRKILAEEMARGDYSRVEADAIAQVEAGAHMLDVNAGVPLADEPGMLADIVKLVQSITDVPLSIDSSIVAALEAGLSVYEGKALVNSVTGEEERLESVLPLVKRHGAAVVAISNDETGISEDPDVRFAVAKKIVERAADHGIPREDVVVDPLVMPIGAINSAGTQVMRIVRRLREGTQGQHHMRRIQRQFRIAQPQRHQFRLSHHGHRRGHDLGDHESPASRSIAGRSRRRCDDGPRSRLRKLVAKVPPGAGRAAGARARQPAPTQSLRMVSASIVRVRKIGQLMWPKPAPE